MENDSKKRYMLIEGPDDTTPTAGKVWWIRANQGHSLKVRTAPDQLRLALTSTQEVALDLKPILSAGDIPMAVHGTNRAAWASICSP